MLVLLLATSTGSIAQNKTFGNLPPLHVDGKYLKDANGNIVRLHGVMDTPNPYFNGGRWGNSCSDSSVGSCLSYFNKLFTAITDTTNGAYCNAFRLHLDPCWTNDPSLTSDGKESGEADISRFSNARLTKYMKTLYYRIASYGMRHGLYIIMRPPGVCPGTIQVGDYYQEYLMKVWDTVTKNDSILKYSGQISIELANEPVRITDNGKYTDNAMTSYFQPIVNLLRTNSKTKGFTGIIWVPGMVWQQEYKGYSKYPVSDPYNNLGYAVHWYPGWYSSCGGTNKNVRKEYVMQKFLESVPVAKTSPIIITEIDWSPYNMDGTPHKDEQGNEVYPNYGTWATSYTSSFGQEFKYVHDQLGNLSMTLSGTATYLDIDQYLKNRRVTPAFDGMEEACGKACFDWYKEWYEQQNGSDTDGIETITNDADVIRSTYYNMQGLRVDKPQRGVYIVKQLLKNGKITSKKVCNIK